MLESLNLKSLRKAEYYENLHVFFNSRHHITVSTNYHKTTTLLYDSTFRLLTSHYFHFHVTPHCISCLQRVDWLWTTDQVSCAIIIIFLDHDHRN